MPHAIVLNIEKIRASECLCAYLDLVVAVVAFLSLYLRRVKNRNVLINKPHRLVDDHVMWLAYDWSDCHFELLTTTTIK